MAGRVRLEGGDLAVAFLLFYGISFVVGTYGQKDDSLVLKPFAKTILAIQCIFRHSSQIVKMMWKFRLIRALLHPRKLSFPDGSVSFSVF